MPSPGMAGKVLGVLWTTLYVFVEGLQPGSFHVSPEQNPDHVINRYDLVFFSFVTLTTLGYGDITPVTALARSLAVLQSLVGVLYNAILVVRLVGLYRPLEPSFTHK
jgi:voltage-gated potassium channel